MHAFHQLNAPHHGGGGGSFSLHLSSIFGAGLNMPHEIIKMRADQKRASRLELWAARLLESSSVSPGANLLIFHQILSFMSRWQWLSLEASNSASWSAALQVSRVTRGFGNGMQTGRNLPILRNFRFEWRARIIRHNSVANVKEQCAVERERERE